MTKFEVLKRITDEKKFSELIFDLIAIHDTSEKFTDFLREEIPEEGLRTIKLAVQHGYPISLEGMQ